VAALAIVGLFVRTPARAEVELRIPETLQADVEVAA
jgi:hypothetical protein